MVREDGIDTSLGEIDHGVAAKPTTSARDNCHLVVDNPHSSIDNASLLISLFCISE
jgi:hypothetical protein